MSSDNPNCVNTTEHEKCVLMTLDDGKANALSFAAFKGLNAGLDIADAAGKVVVIAGRPGKFSAGFDLAVMQQGGEATRALIREGAELSHRLMGFHTPVVLAVSGHALAMGALLCLSADFRVGTIGDYKIGLNEVAIGMTLPWFAIELARARLEETALSQAVGLARIYPPVGAVSVGYLDEIVEADVLVSHALDVADKLSSLNMPAHFATKKRMRSDYFERYANALQRDMEDLA